MKLNKVYSCYYDSSDIFAERGYSITQNIHEADIIILNGGEDIGTGVYNEDPINRYGHRHLSRRDFLEINAYNIAIEKGALIFGICRGAQLANCLAGGSLWQHVDNHGRDHLIYDLETGEVLTTTSVHHQQMIPTDKAKIIAVSAMSTLKYRQGERIERIKANTDPAKGHDVEVLWYPHTRALCIQGHPEYGYKPFTDYCFRVLDRVLQREEATKAASQAVG